MTGIFNACGEGLNIFSGQIQDLTFGFADDVVNDDRSEPTAWVDIDDLVDTTEEPVDDTQVDDVDESLVDDSAEKVVEATDVVDPEFEMTKYTSYLLGADYDDSDTAKWLSDRYGDVIQLNDTIGYTPIRQVEQIVPANDDVPVFRGRTRAYVPRNDKDRLRRAYPDQYDKLRGRAKAK